jgi:plasmid stabilization system protein ParE
MAKRIVWTEKADLIFTKSLEYFTDRNKSKEFSRKLNKDIRAYLEILAKQPFLGKKTNEEDIRVLIKGNYKIFYQIDADMLIIHLVWDCRQKPESLNIKHPF